MFTSSLFLKPPIQTEFLVIIFDRPENRSLRCLKEKQVILYSQLLPKNYNFIASRKEKCNAHSVKITISCGNYRILTFFSCCFTESRTKDHRALSPFFKLQAKYLRLELATSGLSRRT